MQKRQMWGLLVMLAATVGVVALTWACPEPQEHTIPLEGEAYSPDGRFELRQIDEGGDGEPVPSMETVRVVDTATGEVLWENSGYCETSAMWSPGGQYLALTRRTRTHSAVTVLETQNFTGWEVPLPDGAASAEYAAWHANGWRSADALSLRYRDAREEGDGAVYLCSVCVEGGRLTGALRKQETGDVMAPVARAEGETVSPGGRYEVRTVGVSGNYVSGVRIPEKLQVVRTDTGEVMWEDMGYLRQSALWSPDGRYLALAYGGRTWNQVLMFETETWTTWQFTLPDGGAIPEYTFLPLEGWGIWIDENTIRLTIGRGGDGEEQRVYRCSVLMPNRGLNGSVVEETADVLAGDYDFDHDGQPDAVELVTVWGDREQAAVAWYELRVEGSGPCWTQELSESHVGWVSVFAVNLEGQDYLLRYAPWMGQGFATYDYQLFSLDEMGEEVLYRENGVEFDVNFRPTLRGSFDPAAIAAFLEEVHAYLEEGALLASTEGGSFRTGGSGADFREDFEFFDDWAPYDERKSLEENLRDYAEQMTAARSGGD